MRVRVREGVRERVRVERKGARTPYYDMMSWFQKKSPCLVNIEVADIHGDVSCLWLIFATFPSLMFSSSPPHNRNRNSYVQEVRHNGYTSLGKGNSETHNLHRRAQASLEEKAQREIL